MNTLQKRLQQRARKVRRGWRQWRADWLGVALLKYGDRCVMPDGRIETIQSVRPREGGVLFVTFMSGESVVYLGSTDLRVLPRKVRP